jgi:hypothetical protein
LANYMPITKLAGKTSDVVVIAPIPMVPCQKCCEKDQHIENCGKDDFQYKVTLVSIYWNESWKVGHRTTTYISVSDRTADVADIIYVNM